MIRSLLAIAMLAASAASSYALDAASIPTKFPIPWGDLASSPYIRPIPEASQIGIQNGAASLQTGFPPATFTPTGAGGTPPFGSDFNGIFKQITQWSRWQAAGAPVFYDGGFSTSITGYPKGSILSSTTNGLFWLNLADNNTVDPDAAGTNWARIVPVVRFCSDGGSANAYSCTFTPSIVPVAGDPFGVLIANGNTTSSTLNVGAGALPIQRRDGSALIGNELVAGQVASFRAFGSPVTAYRLEPQYAATAAAVVTGTDTQSTITPAQLASSLIGLAGHAVNLSGVAQGGNKVATWTASELIAEVTLGGRPWRGGSLSLSFNGAGTGANGMDTGSMPAAGDLSVYAIYNPSTVTWATLGTLGSTSNGPVYSGANMPSGYTASALIFSGKTTGSNFVAFSQVDHWVYVATTTVLTSGSGPVSYTAFSVSSVVPSNARTCGGTIQSNGNQFVFIAGTVGGFGEITTGSGNTSYVAQCASQQMFYKLATSASMLVTLSSYSF